MIDGSDVLDIMKLADKGDPFFELRGRFQKKPAFILGSGPSLRFLDPSILKDHLVVAVNGSILKCPKAMFYLSCDGRVTLRSHWEVARTSGARFVLSASGAWTHAVGSMSDQKVKNSIWFKQSRSHVELQMRASATKLISGGSSILAATHFANILGASPLVLLGCDCCSEEGKNHFFEFPGQPKDEYKEGVQFDTSEQHSVSFGSFWERASEHNADLKILNASGGALECFPRVKLEDVL
jgi:hypothetical protein